jgi:hypothetical protein
LALIGHDLFDGLKELQLTLAAQREASTYPGAELRGCTRLASWIQRAVCVLVQSVVLRPGVRHRRITVQNPLT